MFSPKSLESYNEGSEGHILNNYLLLLVSIGSIHNRASSVVSLNTLI